MAEIEANKKKSMVREILWRTVKTTIKATLFYVFYLLIWSFIAPLSVYVPSLQTMAETFVTVYIILMVIGDFTSGTIFAHAFNMARALFVIFYLILSMQSGVFSMTFQGVSLMVDLSFLMVFAMLLGLLGVAKSILQAINYLSQKAELQ
ncbi:MAG: hypothetical protein QW840_04160 [Candidatus Bathyarchaeia archaeon]